MTKFEKHVVQSLTHNATLFMKEAIRHILSQSGEWRQDLSTDDFILAVSNLQIAMEIPFADLKALVETPLAEEDANQFIDVDVRPTKSTFSDEEIWQLLSALCGASNATQFQALPRPQQKLHLFAAHEEGIGLRTLSRLTGVPYSIVQRATSDTVRYGSMV